MHHEVRKFIAENRPAIPGRVCDVGGRDVNGTLRSLFLDADQYMSVDLRDGPAVDIVGDITDRFIRKTLRSDFDTVICTEVLEHAENWRDIVKACADALDVGGTLMITCAGPGRAPHSAIDDQPIRPDEFYGNISADLLKSALRDAGISVHSCREVGEDTQAVGTRPWALASVVIPLFNRLDLTQGCLAAIGDEADEIILVDNASTDDTRDFPVTIRNDTNLGFSAACNQGAEAARNPVVVFLNNDTIPTPGWLAPLVAPLVDPTVGAVGGKLLNADGSIQAAGFCIDLSRPYGYETWPITQDWTADVEVVDAACGANMAVRRDTFLDSGGFDDAFYNGHEDMDYCLRLRSAGLDIFYAPRSVVTHLGSQSGPERWARTPENIALLQSRWSGRVPSRLRSDAEEAVR